MIPSKYLLISLVAPMFALALSATEWVTIISAVGAFIVIVGGQIVNIIVALRTSEAAEVIKGHVNSEKTAAEGRENTLKRENEILRETLRDKTQVAAVLAASSPPISPKVDDAKKK